MLCTPRHTPHSSSPAVSVWQQWTISCLLQVCVCVWGGSLYQPRMVFHLSQHVLCGVTREAADFLWFVFSLAPRPIFVTSWIVLYSIKRQIDSLVAATSLLLAGGSGSPTLAPGAPHGIRIATRLFHPASTTVKFSSMCTR